MAKGIGLIGNFKGKVGNMVGYKLTASNTGNTQGVRVYQPIVKNPKTSAQAEQRAKLAPINATYRALKMVIDRGNEGLHYGNKSRLAWLKQAFRAENMPWFEKGKLISSPVVCQLTKGSLVDVNFSVTASSIQVEVSGVTSETDITTIGKLSTALLAGIPSLKEGDQLTFVALKTVNGQLSSRVFSIVLDTTSADSQSILEADGNMVFFDAFDEGGFGCVIVSREGSAGEHLRSTTNLMASPGTTAAAPYDTTSKTAAIESYRSSAAVNADWAEESIQ